MIIKFGIKTKVSCQATAAPEIVGRAAPSIFVLRALGREKSGGKATVIQISGNGRCKESNRRIAGARAYTGFFFLVASLLAGRALGQQADIPDAQKNPFAGDPAAVAAGKTLYEQTCQACHGGEGRGDRGPALASGNFKHGSGDLRWVVFRFHGALHGKKTIMSRTSSTSARMIKRDDRTTALVVDLPTPSVPP